MSRVSSRRRLTRWVTTAAGYAIVGYALYQLWRAVTADDDELDEEEAAAMTAGATPSTPSSRLVTSASATPPSRLVTASATPLSRPTTASRSVRRPSFSVTDEQGTDHGVLADGRAHEWGWLVSEEPLAPVGGNKRAPKRSSRKRQSLDGAGGSNASLSGYASDTNSSADDTRGGPARPSSRAKGVRFKLDERAGFYGFVFSFDGGVCVAHGADPAFVGLTLAQVLERTSNLGVDAALLHERFCAAAAAGGGFVSYAWRNDKSAAVRLKGAYIIEVSQWGRRLYAGVGYSLVPPPPPQEVSSPEASPTLAPTEASLQASGLYSFVCTSGGRLLAHGASKEFVGRTLADVIEATGNTRIESHTLLARFEAAAARGGGWVSYPWRNSASDPLRLKGAYVSRLERPAATGEGGGADGGHLFAGVGFFGVGVGVKSSSSEDDDADEGSRPPPAPPPIPPSQAAARAATAALKRELSRASDDGAALQSVMSDASGILAASAAKVTCWEATELPAELAALLRDHAMGHILDFNNAT